GGERAEGARQAGDLFLPTGQPGRPGLGVGRPPLHHPGLARRGHVPAATIRVPLRVTHPMRRDRRDFLELCGLAGLGLAAPFRPTAAGAAQKKDEPYAGPYYVVFSASGGWDTTYLMDPKGVNGINRLYKEGDILTKGAHKYAPIKKHAQGG